MFSQDRITIEHFKERDDESDYWESVYAFVESIWDRDVDDLSDKQITWLDKILGDMVEWRITKRK